MRRAPRALLSSLLAALLGCALLEGGARLLGAAGGSSAWIPAENREAIEQGVIMLSRRGVLFGGHLDPAAKQAQPDPAVLHPYLGFVRLRSEESMAEEQAEYRREDSARAFDVCVLGGSVAQTFGVLGAERLAAELGKDPRLQGREIRIHDSAIPAFKQLQLVQLLAYLFALGHRPDAVIEIDGFNEAAHGWANARAGTHPLHPYLGPWVNAASAYASDPGHLEDVHRLREAQDCARAFGERLLESGAWRSAFLGRLGRLRFESLRRDHADAYRGYVDRLESRSRDGGVTGPTFDARDDAVAATIASGWEQGSLSMHGMCAERGVVYLHVLQPTLKDPGSKTATAKELAQATGEPEWIEGVERVYPLLREAGRRLASRGVAFLDASGVFRDHEEDVYVDLCHFGEHGNDLLARAVAPALLEALPK